MKKENLNKIIPLSLFFFISMNYLLLTNKRILKIFKFDGNISQSIMILCINFTMIIDNLYMMSRIMKSDI